MRIMCLIHNALMPYKPSCAMLTHPGVQDIHSAPARWWLRSSLKVKRGGQLTKTSAAPNRDGN